jgi:hypothetical protein
MEMENTGKLEYLKVVDIDTEPFLFPNRNKQEMADYDEVSRPDQIVECGTKTRASHGSEDGLRLRNKTGNTTWNRRNATNTPWRVRRRLSLSTPIQTI